MKYIPDMRRRSDEVQQKKRRLRWELSGVDVNVNRRRLKRRFEIERGHGNDEKRKRRRGEK